MSSSKIDNNMKNIKSQFLQIKIDNFKINDNDNKNNRSNLSTKDIITKIFKKFNKKYNIMAKRYNSIIIDNLIFKDKSHMVSIFKDFIINYDSNDFLKRFYNREESEIRLPKYFEYYNLYSKIFPNYTSIPEGKYFYVNIKKKQRMIDLQEEMEKEKSKEKKANSVKKEEKEKKEEKVFNTSVMNSILNRTNKEEMEMLFDIYLENSLEEEYEFYKNINKLIENIDYYEIKEDIYIDYNYEEKNEKNNNKKEIISPLMNININYINFNKFNDVKTNSVSFNNQNNKNNTFLYKIFNIQNKNSKRKLKNKVNDKSIHNEGFSFLMKKQHNNSSIQYDNNYLNHANNSIFSLSKHGKSCFLKNNLNNNNKLMNKNKTIVCEYKAKNKNPISAFRIDKSNISFRNIFSSKTIFGSLSSYKNKNMEMQLKLPLSSRNKNNNYYKNDENVFVTIDKYFTRKNNQNPSNNSNNQSILSKKDNNLYVLINNSRNKILINNKPQKVPSTGTKFLNIRNSISPVAAKFKLKSKKKLEQNYSLLNNRFFNKNSFLNNKKNKTILKEQILLNNFINEENILSKNKNINKDSSLVNNNSNSIKSKKIYHNYSSRNLNANQINKKINKNRDSTGKYVKKFIKAFNNSKKLRSDFLSQREKEM